MTEQPGLGFAELLRQLRAEARLTQEELADAAGLSPRSVSDLERGIHQTARKHTAGLLAGALGLAEPARTLFVAAARGRIPVAEVLTALRAEAAPAAPGGAMPPEANGAPPTPPEVVPRQLPAGAGFFAGREAELKELDALLGSAGLNGGEDGPGGAVVISAVAGMAGVGKTALDAATSLRQLLSWSYRQLSPPAAQMFALVGVHRGPDITVPAAASLAAVPRAAAGRALAELAEASLAVEHRPGRYVLHDLVRRYAAGRARQVLGEAGIRAAIERSLDHYLHTKVISSDIPAAFAVAPAAPGVLPEELADEAALQNWTRAEHQVVLQAIAQAAAAGFLTHAWQIFCNAAWFLGGQGYWADIRAAGQAVLAAAEAAGDQVALGWTQATISRYGPLTGADDEDRAHAARAGDHFRRPGDLSGQAWAHLSATVACFMKGDWADAASLAGRALALSRQAGDQAGQGWALAGLGECHAHLGNYDLARSHARQALGVTPEAGDPTALAFAWHALGFVHARHGEPRQAIGCYRQALALVGEPNHALARWMRYMLLVGFGDACRAADDLPAAVEAWQQAQQILRDLGWPENARIRARLEQAGPPSLPG